MELKLTDLQLTNELIYKCPKGQVKFKKQTPKVKVQTRELATQFAPGYVCRDILVKESDLNCNRQDFRLLTQRGHAICFVGGS